MRLYEDAKELVEREIETIVKKDEISPSELDCLDKLIDISKDLHEIEDMQIGGMSSGMSGHYRMPYYGAVYYEDASYGRNRGGNSSYTQGGNSGRYNSNYERSYGRNGEMRMNPDMRGDW